MEAKISVDPSGRRDWFLLIGCQRSGTTLMRLILESHSQVECYDEFLGYKVLSGRLLPKRGNGPFGLKVPCVTEQLHRPVLFDRAVLPETKNPYCGQKLIFMIRDVRDVVRSMMRLTVGKLPWFEMYCIPAFHDAMERNTSLRERYAAELTGLEQAHYPNLAKAALYWRYKVEALFTYVESDYPVLTVKYEDLVTQPVQELHRVCQFLDVPWEASLLDHARAPHKEVMKHGRTVGNTDPTRPIDGSSVGHWRESFTADAIEEILQFAGPTQATLYPPLSGIGLKPVAGPTSRVSEENAPSSHHDCEKELRSRSL